MDLEFFSQTQILRKPFFVDEAVNTDEACNDYLMSLHGGLNRFP